MPDDATPTHDRRRFVTRLGATLAAGLGLSALGGSAAAAATLGSQRTTCAIYCYPHTCPGNCPPGYNYFRCEDRCSGTWYDCLPDPCCEFCFSTDRC